MKLRIWIPALLMTAFVSAGFGQQHVGAQALPGAPTPPPPPQPVASTQPIPLGATPQPTISPALPVPRARASAAPGARRGIEGVWEIQVQRPERTTYTHWKLVQNGTAIAGFYLDGEIKVPLSGTFDGTTVKILVILPDKRQLAFSAAVESGTDMLGLLTIGSESVPFTAAYRPKTNFLDELAPAPGF